MKMNFQTKINILLLILALNFFMLIYLIMIVLSNQKLINQNKGMISTNMLTLQRKAK